MIQLKITVVRRADIAMLFLMGKRFPISIRPPNSLVKVNSMPKVTLQKPTQPAKKTTSPQTQTSKFRSAWDFADTVKCMFYGASATGKTTLWATFPGPILCLVCSGSRQPGEFKSINTPELRQKIDGRIITTMEEVKESLEDMSQFKTVVLDHVTGLQDLALKDVMMVDELPAQKSWGLTDQATWGQATGMCKDVCRQLLGHNGNVVIIGQERRSGDEATASEIQLPTVGVAATPSLAGWLNPAVDYILQTFKKPRMVKTVVEVAGASQEIEERGKGVDYCARIAPHDVFTTKFRVTKDVAKSLPEIIVDPTYDKILSIIQGRFKAPAPKK